jgi:hypothetical protein
VSRSAKTPPPGSDGRSPPRGSAEPDRLTPEELDRCAAEAVRHVRLNREHRPPKEPEDEEQAYLARLA